MNFISELFSFSFGRSIIQELNSNNFIIFLCNNLVSASSKPFSIMKSGLKKIVRLFLIFCIVNVNLRSVNARCNDVSNEIIFVMQ